MAVHNPYWSCLGGGGGGRHLVYAHCDSSLHVNIFQVIDASLRERAHGAYRRLILGSIFNLLKEEDFPC